MTRAESILNGAFGGAAVAASVPSEWESTVVVMAIWLAVAAKVYDKKWGGES